MIFAPSHLTVCSPRPPPCCLTIGIVCCAGEGAAVAGVAQNAALGAEPAGREGRVPAHRPHHGAAVRRATPGIKMVLCVKPGPPPCRLVTSLQRSSARDAKVACLIMCVGRLKIRLVMSVTIVTELVLLRKVSPDQSHNDNVVTTGASRCSTQVVVTRQLAANSAICRKAARHKEAAGAPTFWRPAVYSALQRITQHFVPMGCSSSG